MITTLYLAASLTIYEKLYLAEQVRGYQAKQPVIERQYPAPSQSTGSFPPCSKGERISNSLGTVWSGSKGYVGSAAECPISSKVVEE